MLTISNQSSTLSRLTTTVALLCAGVFSISAFHPEMNSDSFESNLGGSCFPIINQNQIIPENITDPFAMLEYTSNTNSKRYSQTIYMSMFEALPSSHTAIQNQTNNSMVAQPPTRSEVKFEEKTSYTEPPKSQANKWKPIKVEITAYCPCAICCPGTADGKTANNNDTDKIPYNFAGDIYNFKLGDKIWLPTGLDMLDNVRATNRIFIVDDRGGGLNTEALTRDRLPRLDLRVKEHWWAKKLGRQQITVWIKRK